MTEENKSANDYQQLLLQDKLAWQQSSGSPIQTDWSMFRKENELGEGSFG
jgi:hypothetical protein